MSIIGKLKEGVGLFVIGTSCCVLTARECRLLLDVLDAAQETRNIQLHDLLYSNGEDKLDALDDALYWMEQYPVS